MCKFSSIQPKTLTQIHPFTIIYSKCIDLDHSESAVRPLLQITLNSQPQPATQVPCLHNRQATWTLLINNFFTNYVKMVIKIIGSKLLEI